VSRLQSLLAKDMENLTEVILKALQNDVELIPTIAKHLILAGGKRLRPLLTLACFRMIEEEHSPCVPFQKYEGVITEFPHIQNANNENNKIVELAAAIEFIHNATLLHDDVVDASSMRRGRPTANVLWGNKASILVGDFLFAKAFELMLGDSGPRVLHILAKVAQTITEGEVLQLSYLRTFDMTEHNLLHIIGTKTAALFGASCEIGAALLNKDEAFQQQLHEYGYNLGIAFQLVDDILDYTGDETALGKSIGDDLSEGKVTLPLFIAYNRSSNEDQEKLQAIISKSKVTEDDFSFVQNILLETGATASTFELAHVHVMEAMKCMNNLEISQSGRAIQDILHDLPKSILVRQG
jgi:octaprenyl-diphosphate synthase